MAKILELLNADAIDWDKWERKLTSPHELQRQMDNWACGIFVMLAIKLLVEGNPLTEATNDRIESMRQEALHILLEETRSVNICCDTMLLIE